MNTHKHTTNTLNTGTNAVPYNPPTARQKQPRLKHRQGGFTAIELGVVLLVIGVLSIAVFQVMAGMVSAAKFSAMSDQLVASTLRLQQRYINEPPFSRYGGMAALANTPNNSTARTLTEALRTAINSDGDIQISDTGTAKLESSSATGGSGESNLMWTLDKLESGECKILIRKLAPPARVILSGATGTDTIRSRPGDDALEESEIDDTCTNDDNEDTNAFRAVF